MDGFDFIGALRRSPAWKTIPVVVVTARDIDAHERERLNGSVAKVLRKAACRRDELLQEVRQHVKACRYARPATVR
jgi:CheY-like chemotaxis protein